MSESSPLVAGIACRQLAINEGADDHTSQLALALGYMQGLTPISLIASVVLARRNAETRASNGASDAATGRVAVPALAAGAMPADATAAVTAAGLVVSATTIREPSTTVPADQVIRTQPAAGTWVARGSAVVLVISGGPPPTPNG